MNREVFEQHAFPDIEGDFSKLYTIVYYIKAAPKMDLKKPSQMKSFHVEINQFFPPIPLGATLPSHQFSGSALDIVTANFTKDVQHGIIENPSQDPMLLFELDRACRVMIWLPQTFWRFSAQFAPITTKKDHGSRYHNAGGLVMDDKGFWHEWNDRPELDIRAAYFYTQHPVDRSLGIRHGFSFNIDLLECDDEGKLSALPITIDPDAENKGSIK